MNAPTPTPATTQPRPAAKHTPGPWTVIDAITTKERYHIATDNAAPYASMIAHLHGTDPKHGDKEANARLIAAAPALLEALRKTLDALEIAHEYASKTAPALSCVKWAETEDAARAALAQAEGGAQ